MEWQRIAFVFILIIAIGSTNHLFSNNLSNEFTRSVSSKSAEMDDPIIFKTIANLAVEKTSNIITMVPVLLEAVFSDAKQTGEEFVQSKIQAINDASSKLVSGVKTTGKVAIGLAVKVTKTVKKGVKVVGSTLLKPVFYVIGSKMKILGTGLKVFGVKTKIIGTVIKDAGKVLKTGDLGSVGFGATAIGWGTDSSNDNNQPQPPQPQFFQLLQIQPQPQPQQPLQAQSLQPPKPSPVLANPNPAANRPQLPDNY